MLRNVFVRSLLKKYQASRHSLINILLLYLTGPAASWYVHTISMYNVQWYNEQCTIYNIILLITL